MPETVDIHALAGAYALDALDDLERAAFDRHLRDCISCAVEVAELRETAARLTDLTAVAPPARLRDAVLTEIGRTAQERNRRSAPGRAGTRRDRLRRWAVTAVAAAVLACAVGIGTWTVAEHRIEDIRADNARIDAILTAADAHLINAEMAGGRLTVVVSRSHDAAVAVLNNLKQPDPGQAYQLWMVGATPNPRNVGVVASGTARAYISGLAPKFAVTRQEAERADIPKNQLGQMDL